MSQVAIAAPPIACRLEAAASPTVRWLRVLAGGAAVLLFCGAFILQWWNRYLSPTVGGELFFAAMAERGALPYRDYFFPMQPGLVFQSAWLSSLFGQKLIVFWIAGVALRLASSLCLYCWLVRWFRPTIAAAAVVLTFFVASADIADFPAFYNHQAMAFSLFGSFCALKALERESGRGYAWAFAAGLLLAINFWIKQTTGVIVDFAVVLAFVVASCVLLGWRQAVLKTATIGAGLSIPVALVGYWLYRNQLVADYFDQVYLSGPASKGGLIASLLRPVALTDMNPWLHWPALIALVALGLYAYSSCQRDADAEAKPLARLTFLALAGICAIILVRERLWENILVDHQGAVLGLHLEFADSRTPLLACAYLCLMGNLMMILFAVLAALRGQSDFRLVELGFLAVLGFACAYSLSISWAAFETMAFPGLALLAALGLERVFSRKSSTVARALTVTVCLLLMMLVGWRKYAEPFSWGFLKEPALTEGTVAVSAAPLAGFKVAAGTARLFAEIPALIRAHARDDERILIYPHMPIFYALAQRPLATFAVMHWMDVCPDRIASRDAAALQAEPPAVIVTMDMPSEVYDAQEAQFRNGQTSGQRKLAEVLAKLTPAYDLVGEFQAAGQLFPIKVWAKKR